VYTKVRALAQFAHPQLPTTDVACEADLPPIKWWSMYSISSPEVSAMAAANKWNDFHKNLLVLVNNSLVINLYWIGGMTTNHCIH